MDNIYALLIITLLIVGIYIYLSLDHINGNNHSNTLSVNVSMDRNFTNLTNARNSSHNFTFQSTNNNTSSSSNLSNRVDTANKPLCPTNNITSPSSNMSSSQNDSLNLTEDFSANPCLWYNSSYWKSHPLRGAVIEMGFGSPYEVGPPYPNVSSLKLLRSYGANVVNLEIQYTWTMYPPYKRDPHAFQLLRDALHNIREAGLYAIVSIRNGPGRNDMFSGLDYEDKLLLDIYHDPIAQKAWLDMLNDTISEFSNDSTIIAWDPMVEPAPYEYTSRKDLPDSYGYSWWNNFSKECVSVIRSVDPVRPIIIEASDWANPHSFVYLEPINDSNIIYSVHNYWPMEYSHQSEPPFNYSYPGYMCYWDELNDEEQCGYVDRDKLDQVWGPVDEFQRKYNATIFVGEWGGMRFVPGMPDYLRDQLYTIEKRGWSHTYYAWGFDPGWDVQAFQLACGSNLTDLNPDPNSDTFRYIYQSWQKNDPLSCD